MFEEINHRFQNSLGSFEAEHCDLLAGYFEATANEFKRRADELRRWEKMNEAAQKNETLLKFLAPRIRECLIRGLSFDDAIDEIHEKFFIEKSSLRRCFFQFYGPRGIENAYESSPSYRSLQVRKDKKEGMAMADIAKKHRISYAVVRNILTSK